MKHHKILQQSLHEIDISMIALHYVHSDHRVDSDDVVKWEGGQHRGQQNDVMNTRQQWQQTVCMC